MVLDAQIDDFAAADRLAYAALGLVSVGARVAALAARPRVDGGRAPDGPLADVILGLLSVVRTLRAELAAARPAAATERTGATGVGAGAPVGSIGPGLLR